MRHGRFSDGQESVRREVRRVGRFSDGMRSTNGDVGRVGRFSNGLERAGWMRALFEGRFSAGMEQASRVDPGPGPRIARLHPAPTRRKAA